MAIHSLPLSVHSRFDITWHIIHEFNLFYRAIKMIKRAVLETYTGWHKLNGQDVQLSLPRIEKALDEVRSLTELLDLLTSS